MDFAELFQQGGALMWAILAASIVGAAVFMERLWSLQRSRVLPRDFVDRVRALVGRRKTSEAQVLCEENKSSIAAVMAAAIRTHDYGKTRAEIKEAVEEVGNREIAHMDRNVEIIGTVAQASPLMGLLGTVIGMIFVFQDFVQSYQEGTVGPDSFAEGIWQALITTAFGLTVAIPMLVAYKYLQGRNDRLIVDMEEDAMGLVDLLEDAARRDGSKSKDKSSDEDEDEEDA
ncbi:MAG: MotA/TolQ/ExbB proton channel family protein [Nannocystaceae bacterium]|nr:MotA/TolQ/ExbB proton channel family protein [bacterium]